jgi:ABC-type lipoprotein release transport system permease subunit
MVLLKIALRNILATRVRTLIIGLLVVFGTTLVVLGGSLLSTLELSMARSIIRSVAGHLQIYSSKAKDKLEMFSPPTSTPNLGRIDDFPKVRALIEELDVVDAVVPMGNDFAMVFSGNILDIKLAELRQALSAGEAGRVETLKEHIHQIVLFLDQNMANLNGLISDSGEMYDITRSLSDLKEGQLESFWTSFDEDAEEHIVFLENKIAKLAMDEKMLFLRYIGTDTEAFAKHFDLFEIVKGEKIPDGKRGFLIPEFLYEHHIKHQVARRLDWIKEQRTAGRRIADDVALQRRIDENKRQYKDVIFQLDNPGTRAMGAALRSLLGTEEQDPIKLLTAFLDMDDGNFDERYDLFYREIAPRIILYQVKVGDLLTIRAFTRSGYSTSVNVKVYGTYRFKGMEKSALSGVYCLMDLMTFRDLYGYMTEDKKAELEELKKESGAAIVDRGRAEDALFGEDAGAGIVNEGKESGFDEFSGIDMKAGGKRFTDELLERAYSKEELEHGIVTNASVVLKEGQDVAAAKAAVEATIADHGLDLQVIDWREASGLVGQFISVVWIVLVTAILIIFLVALVIINNSMVMATLDRTREIGTMRAIGAQRNYVLKMFLIESSVLGIGFGLLGVSLGTGIVLLLGHYGIPAWTDELYFLFAGARLYPILLPAHVGVAFIVVLAVSVASTLYPARLAARIQPVRAMGKED